MYLHFFVGHMKNITVEIYSEGMELAEVKRTISKFQKKNNLDFKVKILIDWFSESAGYYYLTGRLDIQMTILLLG